MSPTKTKPVGLPSGNDLDAIPEDLLGPAPANLHLGALVLLTMENPPERGQYVKMEVTLRTRKDGRTLLDDGTYVHFRNMSFISAKVTSDPYKPANDSPPVPDDQAAMIGRDGEINDDLDEFDPEFSDAGSDD